MYYRVYFFIDQKIFNSKTIDRLFYDDYGFYDSAYLYIGKGCGCKIRTLVILPILMLAS